MKVISRLHLTLKALQRGELRKLKLLRNYVSRLRRGWRQLLPPGTISQNRPSLGSQANTAASYSLESHANYTRN